MFWRKRESQPNLRSSRPFSWYVSIDTEALSSWAESDAPDTPPLPEPYSPNWGHELQHTITQLNVNNRLLFFHNAAGEFSTSLDFHQTLSPGTIDLGNLSALAAEYDTDLKLICDWGRVFLVFCRTIILGAPMSVFQDFITSGETHVTNSITGYQRNIQVPLAYDDKDNTKKSIPARINNADERVSVENAVARISVCRCNENVRYPTND